MSNEPNGDALLSEIEAAVVANTFAGVDAMAAAIGTADSRMRHVITKLSTGRVNLPAWQRAVYVGGRSLGWSAQWTRHLVDSCVRCGGFDEMLADRKARFGDFFPLVPDLEQDVGGRIYVAQLADRPGVFKVGFSKTPEARVARVSQKYGVQVRLLFSRPGMAMHESLTHVALWPLQIANEWFSPNADFYRKNYPGVGFLTPDAMLPTIRSAVVEAQP